MRSTARHWGARRLAAALLILCAAALAGILPVAAQRPNGAGIVINFGDGSVLYAYVQFEEETITSEELLYRSGLAVTIAPYSGLGAGVCSIRDVGCPSDNCFCQSYTTPAYFWHFYAYDGGWHELLQGASNRSVGDGDIDGWSWTAGDSGLPAVTIDEIALLNGVDRNAPEIPPTETPIPKPTNTSTLAPTNTPLPTATQLPPTSTPDNTPMTPGEPAATATAIPPETPTSSIGQVAVTPSPTREPTPTATSTRIATPIAPTPTLTIFASATTVAVLVQPDGTAVPVEVIQVDDGSSSRNLMLFGGLVVVAAGAGGRGFVNPLAWLLWFMGVACVPVISRNPFYLVLDLVVVLVVYLSLPRASGAARAWRLFALVGSTLALLSVGFNVLTVHVGDKVFATLPDGLPIVGGNLTWNAFVYGALSALAIATLLVAAAAFNTAVRQGDIIRLVPGSFAGLGIAGSIAMTMVPQTIAAGRDIYDAQRSRGHQFRGLRDARSLIVPLLGSGLERAVTLSEALEARGFGASVAVPEPAAMRRLPLLGAVGLLTLSLLAIASGRLVVGLALMAGAVVLVLRATPRRSRRTRFRTLNWNIASLAVAGAGVAVAVIFGSLLTLTGASLSFDPFPRLNMPPFEPLAGAAILLLLAPIFWAQP